jgi:hypothetical protein
MAGPADAVGDVAQVEEAGVPWEAPAFVAVLFDPVAGRPDGSAQVVVVQLAGELLL